MKTDSEKMKKIEEILIKVGIEVAKKNEGALFVISDKCKYKKLLKQKIEPFSIFEAGARKLLLSIAMIDGAVVVNSSGVVMDYGAKIEAKKVFRGYGTRHSAAYSASLQGETVAILVSQEDKKVKIFKKGKLIVQIDALEKDVEKHVSDANKVLESVGVGTLTTIGVATLAPSLGIAVVPGIILFGIPYYLIRKFKK